MTNRGEEACECVGKLVEKRRQPHSRQSCEATDRNLVQGRWGQASEPNITKPFRSTALVNQEFVQRKLIDLPREIWNPGLGVGLMPKARALWCKPPGDSRSQPRS